METTTTPTTTANVNAVQLLIQMAYAKPCLNARDYISDWRDTAGRRAYNRERAEITRDLDDFHQLLRCCEWIMSADEINQRLIARLSNSGDRLHLNGDRLQYDCGQYYPTEYRPACSRALASILWRKWYDLNPDRMPRDAARQYFGSRSRVFRFYFN